MAGIVTGLAAWWGGLGAGTQALAGGLAATGVGAGLSEPTRPKTPNINIPPPPGAALIDPAGSAAAASQRARQAAAGGLASTITVAGMMPPGSGLSAPNNMGGGPTSGAKQLLGA
jgi:hypothetical protein